MSKAEKKVIHRYADIDINKITCIYLLKYNHNINFNMQAHTHTFTHTPASFPIYSPHLHAQIHTQIPYIHTYIYTHTYITHLLLSLCALHLSNEQSPSLHLQKYLYNVNLCKQQGK